MDAKQNFRIGIDARLAGQEHAGIGRYSENLIRRLIPFALNKKGEKITLVLFFATPQQARDVLGDYFDNSQLQIIITKIKHYGLKEQLLLPKFYKAAKLDLLYVPHWNVPLAYRGKLAITIHDLLWYEQKGLHATTLKPWQYYLKYLAHQKVSQQAVKKALVIFVPTQTVKDTVLKYYPMVKDKIIISKEGIANSYERALQQKIEAKTKIKKQFIYTGSLYPHKNLKLVIQSLKKLPKYRLLIASARNIFQNQIQTLIANYKVKKQVVFLGFVPDEKLINLYQESTALVQPSVSEGFGLTGIEAMASHTPVLASDIKVFKEIYQDAAIFFDPKKPESFIEAVKKLEISNRKKIIDQGLQVAKQYSFDQMAKDIWQALLKQL